MAKKIFFAILGFGCLTASAQELVASFPFPLKKDQDVFQVTNESRKEVLLFVSDKNHVKVLKLKGDLSAQDSMTVERPAKQYANMVGYTSGQQGYRLIWSSTDNRDVLSQLFDFGSHKAVNSPYTLPLKSERVIRAFSTGSKFYILSSIKNSNTVKLYTISEEGQLTENTKELQGFRFFTPDYEKTDLWGLLGSSGIAKINSESPVSLLTSSAKNKVYISGNNVRMTFDSNNDYTQLVSLNLENLDATEKFIKKVYLPFNDKSDLKSNSFLLDDKLFQLKTSYSKLSITINDLDGNLLKEYSVLEHQPIPFKNSDIIQDNGEIKNIRSLKETKQLFQNFSQYPPAISGYLLDGNYLITIGCISEEKSGGLVLMGGMFGVVGSIVGTLISNALMENFNAYEDHKMVYVNCLFSKGNEHVDGQAKTLAFDKIRAFIEDYKNMSSRTIFRLGNIYYYGFYDTGAGEYRLRKFEE